MVKKYYYKVLTKELKAPDNEEFNYKDWETKTFKVKGKLKMCERGLHLYTSLYNVSVGNFGSRIFKCIPIGNFIHDNDKICCSGIKFIKELKPEQVKDSEWSYYYCKFVKDRPEVRKNIKDSEWSYCYCKRIKDRSEIRKYIKDSKWAYRYCRFIKDRPEVRKNIKDSGWAYFYCKRIKDRSEIRKYIKDSGWAYRYCRFIKDRPEIRKYIKK